MLHLLKPLATVQGRGSLRRQPTPSIKPSTTQKISADNLNGFLTEFYRILFKEYRLPQSRILVYGSASRGRWKQGSDLDMAIWYDQTVSLRTKKQVYAIYWSLSDKYGLDLEQAPAPHPPIVFVDNILKRKMAWLVLVSSFDFPRGRKTIKRIFPSAARLKRLLPYIS